MRREQSWKTFEYGRLGEEEWWIRVVHGTVVLPGSFERGNYGLVEKYKIIKFFYYYFKVS